MGKEAFLAVRIRKEIAERNRYSSGGRWYTPEVDVVENEVKNTEKVAEERKKFLEQALDKAFKTRIKARTSKSGK